MPEVREMKEASHRDTHTVCIRLSEMALMHESTEAQIISFSLAGNDEKWMWWLRDAWVLSEKNEMPLEWWWWLYNTYSRNHQIMFSNIYIELYPLNNNIHWIIHSNKSGLSNLWSSLGHIGLALTFIKFRVSSWDIHVLTNWKQACVHSPWHGNRTESCSYLRTRG